MKKEFGKWLMDVAKYLATAVLLSSTFKGTEDSPSVYWVCLFVLVFILCSGLYLVKEPGNKVPRKLKNRR